MASGRASETHTARHRQQAHSGVTPPGMVGDKVATYGCQADGQQPGPSILGELIPGTVWQAEVASQGKTQMVPIKMIWQ